jgi:hypothetical protein
MEHFLMADREAEIVEAEVEAPAKNSEAEDARKEIAARCKLADLVVEEIRLANSDRVLLRVGMKCGREIRSLTFTDKNIAALASIQFEKYVFLADYDAVCSYKDGFIEATVRPIGSAVISNFAYRRLFRLNDLDDLESVKLVLEPPQVGFPRIELSLSSQDFTLLLPSFARNRLTLKLSNCDVSTHEGALALLKKTADSAFFQIDLLSGIALALERERRRVAVSRPQKKFNLETDLQYPKTEFDEAPLSLYWYARGASGMPLLQFLAFYQVIEFYFPTYSQAEAQRKLRAILKDPTFRGDRDADIGKLLSAIYVSKSGSFGDERSQLRATLAECADPVALREFFEASPERREFYVGKGKGHLYHKLPLSNPSADLRNDVADRIYDIRCKIVHTKNDARDGEIELLLPFSKEAAQLSFDIELMHYLSQLVLIAGSTPFSGNV